MSNSLNGSKKHAPKGSKKLKLVEAQNTKPKLASFSKKEDMG